jgi:hypothetical protein
MSNMTLDELDQALEEIFPHGFQIETDSDGQIVIYTHLTENDDGELEPLDSYCDSYDEEEPNFEEHEVYDESSSFSED